MVGEDDVLTKMKLRLSEDETFKMQRFPQDAHTNLTHAHNLRFLAGLSPPPSVFLFSPRPESDFLLLSFLAFLPAFTPT